MNWRDYQQQQQIAVLGEHFVSYLDQGTGDAVVLLHGIPTWGYLWHGLVPALAQHHRVLVPDLVGFGYSDKSDRFDRSIARQAAVVDAWLAQLGIAQATIVGHDIGGGVALRLATLFGQRVARVCLLNSVCYDAWPIEAMLQLGHPQTDYKLAASAVTAMLRQAIKQGFAASPSNEVLDGLLAPYTTEVGKRSLIRAASALNTNLTTELTPLLGEIAVPTLIVWGEDDVWLPVKYGERLAWDIAHAQLERVKDARHFVMLDQPAVVVQHLTSFLAA